MPGSYHTMQRSTPRAHNRRTETAIATHLRRRARASATISPTRSPQVKTCSYRILRRRQTREAWWRDLSGELTTISKRAKLLPFSCASSEQGVLDRNLVGATQDATFPNDGANVR